MITFQCCFSSAMDCYAFVLSTILNSIAQMTSRGLITCAILIWCLNPRGTAATALNDIVDFTRISNWNDLNPCVRSCFKTDYVFSPCDIVCDMGCSTNACLCDADTLGRAIRIIQSKATTVCTNLQDQQAAPSILTSYCADKGYTSIIFPTSTPVPSSPPPTSSTPSPLASLSPANSPSPKLSNGSTLSPSTTGAVTPTTISSINPSEGNGSDSGLTIAEIVGIIIGGLAFVVGAGALIVNWKSLVAQLERRNLERRSQATPRNRRVSIV